MKTQIKRMFGYFLILFGFIFVVGFGSLAVVGLFLTNDGNMILFGVFAGIGTFPVFIGDDMIKVI